MKYWKLENYDYYYLGEDLNVYSTAKGKMVMRKPKRLNDGHIWYVLCKNGKSCLVGRHILVAKMFVFNDNPTYKDVVHHKNGIKTDDRPENLEWMSKSEHSRLHTKGKRQSKEHCRKRGESLMGNKNAISKPIEQWSKDGEMLMGIYNSTHEAERITGIKHSNISACCKNKPHHNTAGGYKWRYKDE